jgi:hypothetical protein
MIFYFALTIPSLIAGYGLLKRKRWARTMGIIAGVTAAMMFPIGTAVCVYSIWFLLSEGGKGLYSASAQDWRAQMRDSLHSAPVNNMYVVNDERARDYAPPAQPPDWRGQ